MRLVGVILVLLTSVACADVNATGPGAAGSSVATTSSAASRVGFPPIDWNNPLGTVVSSVEEADSSLPFAAVIQDVGSRCSQR